MVETKRSRSSSVNSLANMIKWLYFLSSMERWYAKKDFSIVQEKVTHELYNIPHRAFSFGLNLFFRWMGAAVSIFAFLSLDVMWVLHILLLLGGFPTRSIGRKFNFWTLFVIVFQFALAEKLINENEGRVGARWTWWLALLVLVIEHFLLIKACVGLPRAEPEPDADEKWGHFEDRLLDDVYVVASPAFAPGIFTSLHRWTSAINVDIDIYNPSPTTTPKMMLAIAILLGDLISSLSSGVGLILISTSYLYEPFTICTYRTIFSYLFKITLFNPCTLRNFLQMPSLFYHYAVELRGTYYELERISWFRNSIRLKINDTNQDKRIILMREHCAFTYMDDEEVEDIAQKVIDISPGYDVLMYNCQGMIQQLLTHIYTDSNCPMLKTRTTAETHDQREHENDAENFYQRAYKGEWSSLPKLSQWTPQREMALYFTAATISDWLLRQHPTSSAYSFILVVACLIVDTAQMLYMLQMLVFHTSTLYGRSFDLWVGFVQLVTTISVVHPVVHPIENLLEKTLNLGIPDHDSRFNLITIVIMGSNWLCAILTGTLPPFKRHWPHDVCLWATKDDSGNNRVRMLSFFRGKRDKAKDSARSASLSQTLEPIFEKLVRTHLPDLDLDVNPKYAKAIISLVGKEFVSKFYNLEEEKN